jgi:hypothetical protein
VRLGKNLKEDEYAVVDQNIQASHRSVMSGILPLCPESVDVAVMHEENGICSGTGNVRHGRSPADFIVLKDGSVVPWVVVSGATSKK